VSSYRFVLVEKCGNECRNGVRFPTREQAEQGYADLYRRWTLCPSEFYVEESDEAANYEITADGRTRPVGSDFLDRVQI
jgi:hypothetical protein